MSLVICGDSFNVGIGLRNILRDRYGQLVANHFDWDLNVFARGSASNYAIYLQAQYVLELATKPSFVIISVTSFDRMEWLSSEADDKQVPYYLSMLNLNYHDYPPHNYPQPYHENSLDFYLKDNPKYKPILFTEQIPALHEHLDKYHPNKYPRFENESKERLKLIRDYFIDVMMYGSVSVSPMKRDYDISLIYTAYSMLINNGIKVIVMSDEEKLRKLIPEKNFLNHNWFRYADKYPDTIGSLHANEEAHKITADLLIEKINAY
jgi:hypothetical protein